MAHGLLNALLSPPWRGVIGKLDRLPLASCRSIWGEGLMLQRPNQVLVIDDDEAAREILVELLGRVGFNAFAAPDGRAGLEWLGGAAVPPQAVLLDLRMPGLDGFEVLRRYRSEGGTAPVIALSAMDEKEAVVNAMRLGASDYLVKPIEPDELKEAIDRCSAATRPPPAEDDEPQAVPIVPAVRPSEQPPIVAPLSSPRIETGRRGAPADFIASSPAMLSIWDMVDRVAETDVPVLIRGESGVGKEGIARTLHERSPRRGKPFVKINCAALPSELLESELFGHERGAFTGATSEKPGKFELADKGTIFLDENGAMEFSPDVTRRLLGYDYPGNVRELENLVRRLVVLRDERFVLDELKATQARRPALQPALQMGSAGGALPPANQGQQRFEAPPSHPPPPAVPTMLGSAETVSLKEIARQAALRAEREAISAMLARTNWNKRKAAARLQISYKALLYKIKDCGLTDPRITASIPDLPAVGLAANDLSRSNS